MTRKNYHPENWLTDRSRLPLRIWERVVIDDGSCWTWTGELVGAGYGRVAWSGGRVLVHRLSYERFIGPIPEGLEIDHVCRNKACLNPLHLDVVTRQENMRRVPAEAYEKLSQCKRGHEFTPENSYYRPDTGARMCKRCVYLRGIETRRRRRARRGGASC